ncbi:hypothetical protein Goari_025936 [Gossypium aridum]|uniref:RNase H type-1 domain-containing protein n=1 Tax=Gossypium aridum TaxID=34290 RepID=A0A7J8XBP7_GOSAI|nr:hypothetical protein [Gossypium aridum]
MFSDIALLRRMCRRLYFQNNLNKGSFLPLFRIGFHLTFVLMKDCRQLMWLRPLVVGLDNMNYELKAVKEITPVQILQISRMILGFFLSTDGAVARDSGYAGTRGVARDRDGNWIVGFTHFLRVYSPFEAEVWGILDGIFILLNKGYRRVIILTDNLEIVQILSDLDLEDSGITVLRNTECIMRAEGMWKIKHIPRNQNLVAARLAKLSMNWKSSLQVFNEAPKEIIDLL